MPSNGENENLIKIASPWLTIKGEESWRELLPYGQKIILPKGKVLYASGSMVFNLYYLDRGEIMMRSYNQEGRQKIIWYIEEGNIFCETPFFCGAPTFLEIIANSRCEVYKFSRDFVFNELIPHYPASHPAIPTPTKAPKG
ncbi:cyclic nucleotide-binding domain-containing protein [Neomoorella humiferrea]|uniref:Crp/Fnr family transcriptional regulator n=1 Tax=Neomoorella humiferrea TaxID=676965 RepID=UPI003D92FEB7